MPDREQTADQGGQQNMTVHAEGTVTPPEDKE